MNTTNSNPEGFDQSPLWLAKKVRMDDRRTFELERTRKSGTGGPLVGIVTNRSLMNSLQSGSDGHDQTAKKSKSFHPPPNPVP